MLFFHALHRGHSLHELVHVNVLDVAGDEPLVATGVADARDAVAVELVGGLGDDSGTGTQGAGVGTVDILDVEVDLSVVGRKVGRGGIGEHEHCAIDLDLGVADAALRHRNAQAFDGAERIREEVEQSGCVFDGEVGVIAV